MNARECLGNWYNNNDKKWSLENQNELRDKVIRLAQTTSRLTGGTNMQIPVSNYTVTYLYKDKYKDKDKDKSKDKSTMNTFIRGYHGILHNAFYLPEVFLENTFNNGRWIKDKDTTWQSGNTFNLEETFRQLNIKAGKTNMKKNTRNNKKITKINKKITKNTKYNNSNYTLYSSNVIHYKIYF